MLRLLSNLRDLSYHHIIAEHDIKPFLIFVSFLVSFFISRFVVSIFPTLNLIIFEYHIHHFYYGIILLVISNYTALMSHHENLLRLSAIVFGFGLGLITDEIGILLTCGTMGRLCDPFAIYWSRLSFDIAIFLALIFFLWLFLPPVWRRMKAAK